MSRYIGMDVHSASCTLAVVGPSGKLLTQHVVETNARSLITVIKTIPRPRSLCMEEGTQSSWLYEILTPHLDEVVVVRVARSQGPTQCKDDLRDALNLAQRLRTNTIETKVYKDVGGYGKLRELVRVYTFQARDTVRAQNRLKAIYRSRGIQTADEIYHADKAQDALKKLPVKTQPAAQLLHAQYQAVESIRALAEKQLRQEARKHPMVTRVCTIPGIAWIRASQLVTIILSAHRFRTKRQLWKYCGFGVVMRSSSDWVKDPSGKWNRQNTEQTRGLNRNHNSTLKTVFKGAATSVIQRADPDCPLYQHYLAMTQGNTQPNLAKLTIARQIAAITLTIMKKEIDYDRAAVKKNST